MVNFDLPVDRSKPSVERPYPRAKELQSVDRAVDRPKRLETCTLLCTLIDRAGRPTTGPVNRPVDRQHKTGRDKGHEYWSF